MVLAAVLALVCVDSGLADDLKAEEKLDDTVVSFDPQGHL
jgi:hypothetical protein